MIHTLIIRLTALLSRWDRLAAATELQIETSENLAQVAYDAGFMDGTETAYDELVAVLANTMVEVTKPSASTL